jgi:SIR2-like domain/CHAT domain
LVATRDVHVEAPQLVADLAERKVLLVVGAGVSMYAVTAADGEDAGTASWGGLLLNGLDRVATASANDTGGWRGFVEGYRGDVRDGKSYLEAATWVEKQLRSKQLWAEWITETMRALSDRCTPRGQQLMDALAAMRVPIMTTNYDHLLEDTRVSQSGGTAGPSLQTWSWQSDRLVDFVNGDQSTANTVLHVHGEYSQPDSVILTPQSYGRLIPDGRQNGDAEAAVQLEVALRAAYTSHTLLFVGCGDGLEDPHFGALRSFFAGILQNSVSTRHYRLCRAGEKQKLDQEHGNAADRITPVVYGDTYDDLASFLESLTAHTGSPPPIGASKPKPLPPASLHFTAEGVEFVIPGRPSTPAIKVDMDDWPRQMSIAEVVERMRDSRALAGRESEYALLGGHLFFLLGRAVREELRKNSQNSSRDRQLSLSFDESNDLEELACYPWEYLYVGNPDKGGYLLAERWSSLVRTADSASWANFAPRRAEKLEVLLVVPEPSTDRYVEQLRDRIQNNEHREVTVQALSEREDFAEVVRKSYLAKSTQGGAMDVVHLIAKARIRDSKPELCVGDSGGADNWVNAYSVAKALQGKGSIMPPRLVVVQLVEEPVERQRHPAVVKSASAFAEFAPNVVGLQSRGPEDAPADFVGALYDALADGQGFEDALANASAALEIPPSFGLPVVFVGGAPDLFAKPRSAKPERGAVGDPSGRSSSQQTRRGSNAAPLASASRSGDRYGD